jgi:alkylation response protein AidB-like acyl-CoA dehydrogenase
MDFDFSDDQTQLRDAVRKWVDKAYNFDERRSVVAAGGFSASAYQAMAELGLCGLYVQDAYGGMNMGPGRGHGGDGRVGAWHGDGTLGPHLDQHRGAASLRPEDVKTEWLPRLAGGEALLVLAHHEKGALVTTPQMPNHRQPSGWRMASHRSQKPGASG